MQFAFLFISLLSLSAGPIVWFLLRQDTQTRRRRLLFRALDWFVLISITLLLVVEVLPDALARGGLLVLGAFTIGLLLPQVLEGLFRHAARTMHLLALSLALLGIALHTLVDGAMLSGEHVHALGSGENGLAVAIVLHRVPVALAVWWLLFPALGLRWALPALLLMAAATLTGFFAGHSVAAIHHLVATAWLQALTAGMILHAVFNRPHLAAHHHAHTQAADVSASPEPAPVEPGRV